MEQARTLPFILHVIVLTCIAKEITYILLQQVAIQMMRKNNSTPPTVNEASPMKRGVLRRLW